MVVRIDVRAFVERTFSEVGVIDRLEDNTFLAGLYRHNGNIAVFGGSYAGTVNIIVIEQPDFRARSTSRQSTTCATDEAFSNF